MGTVNVKDQVFSGGAALAGSYIGLRELVKVKAMCVLKDVYMEAAVKPWVCKCLQGSAN